LDRTKSLILALLITFLIASNIIFFNKPKQEQVTIEQVIDGDTFKTTDKKVIRLVNINTPEKSEQGYEEAKQYLKKFENKTISIEVIGIDKYDRTLARAYSSDYLNIEIVQLGLATPFLVNEDEVKEFGKARDTAISNQLGLWKKSSLFGCVKASVNKEAEEVSIELLCTNLSLQGWKIRDESRKYYVFKNNQIYNKLMLHSGKGTDNETDLFWGSSENIWNNDRDTLYFLDKENKLVFYSSYGY
jgi:endonuclease YncB( thermonuclease family)